MRTRFTLNEIILASDYARIILYDVNQNVKGEALIDLDDVERCSQYKWSFDGSGYVQAKVQGVGVRLHRFVFGIFDAFVDHRNRVRHDCRKDNLRFCDFVQNCLNSTAKGGLSKYKGVYQSKCGGKWKAQIRVRGAKVGLGTFKNEIEAVLVFDEMARKHHGEFAVLNFPKKMEV